MSIHDETYKKLLEEVLLNGSKRKDRTGTGTISCFDMNVKYDLSQGFPLLTTKKVFWNGVMDETLFFLTKPKYRGSSEDLSGIWQTAPEMFLEDLPDRSKQIWAPWAKPDGSLGRIYGAIWRAYGPMPDGTYFDQMADLVKEIRTNPTSRRMLVTAWSPQDAHNQALPACHTMFQVYVRDGRYLDLKLTQRSNDLLLGCPFNIAGYALLMVILADLTDLEPGIFSHSIGDAHIYLDHLDAVKEQLSRPTDRPAPTLSLKRSLTNLDDITADDFYLMGYNPYPPIKAKVSV